MHSDDSPSSRRAKLTVKRKRATAAEPTAQHTGDEPGAEPTARATATQALSAVLKHWATNAKVGDEMGVALCCVDLHTPLRSLLSTIREARLSTIREARLGGQTETARVQMMRENIFPQ